MKSRKRIKTTMIKKGWRKKAKKEETRRTKKENARDINRGKDDRLK